MNYQLKIITYAGCGLLLGCTTTADKSAKMANYVAPVGHRYESNLPEKNPDGTTSYRVSQYGEAQQFTAPEKIPVWRTRPGPQTGDHLHEPIPEHYIGTRKNNEDAMMQVMGMMPAEEQYSYQTSATPNLSTTPKNNATKNVAPKPSSTKKTTKHNCKKENCPRNNFCPNNSQRDDDGFPRTAPDWARSDYYGLTPAQQALLEKAQKKRKNKK